MPAAMWPRTSSLQVWRAHVPGASYAIGVASRPRSAGGHLWHGELPNEAIVELVKKHFDLRPKGIVQMLDLLRPIYSKTAAYGHFGREEPEFSWEATTRLPRCRGRRAVICHRCHKPAARQCMSAMGERRQNPAFTGKNPYNPVPIFRGALQAWPKGRPRLGSELRSPEPMPGPVCTHR